MGMSTGGGGSANSEINVTPLVDVCLVLLIIFMVMVPRSVPEISVRVPPQQTGPTQERPDQTLIIGLTKEGALRLNDAAIDRVRLSDELGRRLDARTRKVVFVDFDDDANYGEAVEVLELVKRSGAEVLGVIANRDRPIPDTLRG